MGAVMPSPVAGFLRARYVNVRRNLGSHPFAEGSMQSMAARIVAVVLIALVICHVASSRSKLAVFARLPRRVAARASPSRCRSGRVFFNTLLFSLHLREIARRPRRARTRRAFYVTFHAAAAPSPR